MVISFAVGEGPTVRALGGAWISTRATGSLLDGREHFPYQVFLEVLGKLRSIAEPDEDEVLVGEDEAVVVVLAQGHREVGWGAGVSSRVDRPLGAVGGLDLRPGPG